MKSESQTTKMRTPAQWLARFVLDAPQPENSEEREDYMYAFIKDIQDDAIKAGNCGECGS